MELEYFPFYHSYREKTRKLSDQELGRLLRALLEYSITGQRPELEGRECIAFDFIADDMDRAKYNYYLTCARNAENGKKGGRPKKTDGFNKNPPVFAETQKSQSESEYKSKSKINNNLSFYLSDRGREFFSENGEIVENSVQNPPDVNTPEGRTALLERFHARCQKEGSL